MTSSESLQHYMNVGSAEIDGWFFRVDMEMFALVDGVQRANGICGDMFEIGVYRGKSAILLGYLLDPATEALEVCDIFELPESTTESTRWRTLHDDPKPARAQFLADYARFHDQPPQIHAMLSTQLDPDAFGANRFRLIHIDGAHDYENVRHDLELSRHLAGPGAVVVYDDAANKELPAIAAAVWDAVFRSGLEPIALTGKLYATWDAASPVADELRAAIGSADRFVSFQHTIADHTVTSVGLRPRPQPTGRRATLKRVTREWTPPRIYRAASAAQARRRPPEG